MDDLTKGLVFLIVFVMVGLILIFKQNWIIKVNKAKEQAGVRYKIGTNENTDQIENKLIKIIGFIFILVGIAFFIFNII